MASIHDRMTRGETMLAEFSIFEQLRRNPKLVFDAHVAHAGLIYDPVGRSLLARVHRSYLEIAAAAGLPIVAFADTWRASAERIAASPFRGRDVNRDNVEFLREVASSSRRATRIVRKKLRRSPMQGRITRAEAIVAAYMGPLQVAHLVNAGAELIVAATLPAFDEARGIAELLDASGAEWMLSFVVRPSGVLLDGTPLGDAIATIDSSVAIPPAGYSLNCVHPDVAREALARTSEAARRRVLLFQGNASPLPPEELDGRADIATSDAEAFADSIEALMRESSIGIAGGCCGTDESHMRSVARRLRNR